MTDHATEVLPNLTQRGHVLGLIGDFVKKQPLGAAGGLVIAAMFFAAIFAELVATHNPTRLISLLDSHRRPPTIFLAPTGLAVISSAVLSMGRERR